MTEQEAAEMGPTVEVVVDPKHFCECSVCVLAHARLAKMRELITEWRKLIVPLLDKLDAIGRGVDVGDQKDHG